MKMAPFDLLDTYGAVVWCWGGAALLALIVVVSGWVTV